MLLHIVFQYVIFVLSNYRCGGCCGGRDSCPTLATKLEAEKAAQSAHVKKVKNKLKEIKASLFASSDQHKKSKSRSVETIDVRRSTIDDRSTPFYPIIHVYMCGAPVFWRLLSLVLPCVFCGLNECGAAHGKCECSAAR